MFLEIETYCQMVRVRDKVRVERTMHTNRYSLYRVKVVARATVKVRAGAKARTYRVARGLQLHCGRGLERGGENQACQEG